MLRLRILFLSLFVFLAFSSYHPKEGSEIDQLDGIPVYYNGNVANVFGRSITETGYNLGLKYQCVEFVKRYYFERFNHVMPESYGHAKDFFLNDIGDVGFNKERGLTQFRNTRKFPPQKGDILIFGGSDENPFGHMGIVSTVSEDSVEIIQQNYGLKSRHSMKLVLFEGIYTIADFNVLGWLRLES